MGNITGPNWVIDLLSGLYTMLHVYYPTDMYYIIRVIDLYNSTSLFSGADNTYRRV